MTEIRSHELLAPLLKLLERVCTVAGAALLLLAAAGYADAWAMRKVAMSAFEQAITTSTGPTSALADAPIGVLRIDRLGIDVPVFSSTTRTALRRGVGSIEGTALPGESGTIGIAGHRDGVFRPLKDVAVGDVIELETTGAVHRFRVSEIVIVDALDTSVLDPVDGTRLTLVTCYPFYYVGYAPDRWIVHAALEQTRPITQQSPSTTSERTSI